LIGGGLALTCVVERRPDGYVCVGFGRRPCRDETERCTSLCHSRAYPPGRHPALLFPHSFGARREGGKRRAAPRPCERAELATSLAIARPPCRSGFSRDRNIQQSRLKPLLQCNCSRSRELADRCTLLLFSSHLPCAPLKNGTNKSAEPRPGGGGVERHRDVPRSGCRTGRPLPRRPHPRRVGAPTVRQSQPSAPRGAPS